MILESGSQSVLVVAQELFKNRFDLYDLRVGRVPLVAARATSDIDHAFPEFPADRLEFLPVIPVADIQFFLIPLPLAALLAGKVISDVTGWFSGGVCIIMIIIVTGCASGYPTILAWKHLRVSDKRALGQALWVIQNTKPDDSVMDGFTGMGVFRPQAWYYGFVHQEIPMMIPTAKRESMMEDLENGRNKPNIIANDWNLIGLHPRFKNWIENNYDLNPQMDLYVRRQVKDVGN